MIWKAFLGFSLFTSLAWGFTPEKKAWTIFLFAAGDEVDIKEATALTLKRFERVPALNATGPVRVVALHDEVDAGNGHGDGFRYVLEHVAHPSSSPLPDTQPIDAKLVSEQLGQPFEYVDIDSGDPRTLKEFLKWGVRNYPAEHYALILAGHSWGQQGIMQDFYVRGKELEISTMIKNYELRRVMEELYREEARQIPEGKFDLLLIDACTSGQLEIIMEWSRVFKYFAASALETPFNSIPYHEFLGSFISAVASAPNGTSDQTLENAFLKPLVDTYVKSHVRGGSMTPFEKQIDGVEYFALRMEKVESLAKLFTRFVGSMPEEALALWSQGKLTDIENVRDTDFNADLLALSREYQNLAKQKRWGELETAAQTLANAFSYPATDPTLAPVTFDFGKFQGSQGAWVSLEVDELSPLRELAGCVGIKSLGMLNTKHMDLRPRFTSKDKKKLSAHEFRCNELAEEYRKEHPEPQKPLFGTPVPLDTLFEHKVTWPHRKAASIVEYPSKTDPTQVGRRVLSVWVPRAKQSQRDIRLGIIAAGKAIISYRGKKDAILGKQKFELPKHFVTSDFPADGLYVVEGKSSGAHFKNGFGIFLDRDLHTDDWAYVGGRLPIERTEYHQKTITDYLDELQRQGTLDKQAIQGVKFYRAHHVDVTGWPKFLFSGLPQWGSVAGNEYRRTPHQRAPRRTLRSRRYAH